ncbi:glycine oxidase ThiO [Parahaliea mediterranea]|uniref:glycine oxidase ThiO n=1 Tax=Parahaliea mediterranea TaxID=651086 RepID=UPI000E2E4860|nr:glycine oxidase ThiO [Parahaliea mediterranea]
MNIGIAGAGLCGRLLAWQLLRAGHRVTLFERDGSGAQSAGFIAAAMLAPFSEAVAGSADILTPGLQALQDWPAWLAQLARDSGCAVPFGCEGSVVVAHGSDRAELHWFYRRLQGMAAPAAGDCRLLDGPALRQLEPGLGAFTQGLWLPGEGWLDNRALYQALDGAIVALGGQWRQGHTVSAVTPAGLVTDGATLPFERVLDCRGFGARDQLANFRGVRGEVLRVYTPEVQLRRPVRLMHPRYQLYVVPRPAGIYVIGATEIESESLAPVTVRSCLELLSALYTVHPGFAEAQVLEARAHCRPAFADHLPHIIQRGALLQVNGLYRHGYLLAPAVVNSVLSLLAGGEVLAPVQHEVADGPNLTCQRPPARPRGIKP